MPYPHRVRFKDDIIAQCQLPHTSGQGMPAVVFAPGMPGNPNKNTLVNQWAGKGFIAVAPRYRGSWESGGDFLAHEPTDDILDVIDELTHKDTLYSILNDCSLPFYATSIHVIGASFGGPAALLTSSDKRVTSATALSPVVDWRIESPAEPLDWLRDSTRAAFGQAYRFSDADWAKFSNGDFYNPATDTDRVDASKCFILYSADDSVTPATPIETFITHTGCHAKRFRGTTHLGTSASTSFFMSRRIRSHMAACRDAQKQVSWH